MTMHALCEQCGSTDSIEAVPDEHLSNDEQTGGVYRCFVCHAKYGVWIEGGKIDLGVKEHPA